MSTWTDPELRELFLRRTPLVDVRAPVEFADGAIPFSVNLPIMTDEERACVGTTYKERGQEAAIQLGHELVSGSVKAERIRRWCEFLRENPAAEVFCFRGGLRSQISCQWIREQGLEKRPIPGGYKRLRKFLLSWLDEAPLPPLVRIGGLTGSGKTRLLEPAGPHLDLEGLANHRGSAFGPRGEQPAQITFENQIALRLLETNGARLVIEDESVTLGRLAVPRRFFAHLRNSPLVILEVSEEERISNIFSDYVKDAPAEFFLTNLRRIERKLGATKTGLLADEIQRAFAQGPELRRHETWIRTLLHEYYDPLYGKDLRQNQDRVVFRGSAKDVLAYLRSS
jgi:tRNA 2-selenouridine synthase